MRVGFNHPKGIGLHGILIARNLLLLETPFRKLHFVREEITSRQRMPKPEVRPQRPQPLLRFRVLSVARLDFHNPVVVCVALEPLKAISRNLVLEVDL